MDAVASHGIQVGSTVIPEEVAHASSFVTQSCDSRLHSNDLIPCETVPNPLPVSKLERVYT